MRNFTTRLVESRANSGVSKNFLIKNGPINKAPPDIIIPPVNQYDCSGADDRLEFRLADWGSGTPTHSGVWDFVYNVTVNGVNYGTHDFKDIPEHSFGGVTLLHMRDNEYNTGVIILRNGAPNVKHHVKLDAVPSTDPDYLWHANNIWYPEEFVEEGGNSSLTYDYTSRSAEFCLTKVDACNRAPRKVIGRVNDDQDDITLRYNVTINGVDYGLRTLQPQYDARMSSDYINIGDWRIGYNNNWRDIELDIDSHSNNEVAHFKLEPVEETNATFLSFKYDRTIIHNTNTGVIEFCLIGGQDIACVGATEYVSFLVSDRYDNDWSEGLLQYTPEINGVLMPELTGSNLLSDGIPLASNIGGYLVLDYAPGEDNVVVFGYAERRNQVIKVRLIPPPNITRNIISAVVPNDNPTVLLDEATGILSFCIHITVAM